MFNFLRYLNAGDSMGWLGENFQFHNCHKDYIILQLCNIVGICHCSA